MSARSGTRIEQAPFGSAPQGGQATLYSLRRAGAPAVDITDFGATVVRIAAADSAGVLRDVTLGYNELAPYAQAAPGRPYFGCVVGRYAGRIANGAFRLGGRRYVLARNNGAHHLHGGICGFDRRLWRARARSGRDGDVLELGYLSPDGEEGYPGTLRVRVTYSLTAEGALGIDYEATTDRETVLNLTHHAYFNLSGEGAGDVLGHELQIMADAFAPVDAALLPSGGWRAVEGTPLDFRRPTRIGKRIDDPHEQTGAGGGYDHSYRLRGEVGTLRLAARVREPDSGRLLEVRTTEPALHLYTGNFLDGTLVGKSGRPYLRRGGLCLEAQHVPDSPNRPEFPSVVLRPGETYRQTTLYRLSIDHR